MHLPRLLPRLKGFWPPAAGRTLCGWALAFVLSLPVAIPSLMHPLEERSTDIAAFHLYRSILFSDALDQGWLYPRWADALNGGLGSPLFSYCSPGLYYAVDLLHRTGLSHSVAWRALAALAASGAALGAFALALAIGKHVSWALLASALYVYAPALLRDLWQRGSPQGQATALLPWVLLALWRLCERPSGARLALASLAVALLPLVHSLSTALLAPVIVQFGLYLIVLRGQRAARGLTLACLLALGLASVHVSPLLLERESLQTERAQWEGADPAAEQVAWSDLGLRVSAPDAGIPNLNKLNYRQVDAIQMAALCGLAIVLAASWRRLDTPARLLTLGGLGIAAGAIGLQFDWAAPLYAWPGLRLLQFRWRLLSLLAPGLVLAIASIPWPRGAAASGALPTSLCYALMVLSAPRLYPEILPVLHQVRDDVSPLEITHLAYESGAYDLSTGEFQPIWREWAYTEEEMYWAVRTPIANLPEGAQWLADERTARTRLARYSSPVGFEASLHLLYFPGWEVTVDGEPQAAYPSEGGGYLTVHAPAGEHVISAIYRGTPVQRASAAVSGAALACCLILAAAWRRDAVTHPPDEPLAAEPRLVPLAAILCVLVAAKLLWIDPHTTLLRYASTRESIHGATAHVDVRYDGAITLHGWRLEQTRLQPGEPLTITLYWSADEFPDANMPGSFVHLLGTQPNPERGDYLWGQSDTSHRVGQWEQGKLFADTHTLAVDSAAPDGAYQLEIGWWWPETGALFQAQIARGPATLTVADPGYLVLGGLEIIE